MKTNTRIIALCVLTLGAAVPASRAVDQQPAASDKAPARMEPRREERMKQLDEKLHLTPEQKAKIETIWKEAGEEAKEERQAERQSARERRKQLRETMKETRAQIRAVLTPEQRKVYDAMPRPAGHGAKDKAQAPTS